MTFFVTKIPAGRIIQLLGYDLERLMIMVQNPERVDCYISYWYEDFDRRSLWLPPQSAIIFSREYGDQVWAPIYVKCVGDVMLRVAFTTVSRE